MHYIYLTVAVISEVIATSSLKATNEFSRILPSLIVIAGYLSAFYFLTLCLRSIPVGVAYALWSGLGIVLVAAAGFLFYDQKLDFPAIAGMALIIAGVAVINIFSKSISH